MTKDRKLGEIHAHILNKKHESISPKMGNAIARTKHNEWQKIDKNIRDRFLLSYVGLGNTFHIQTIVNSDDIIICATNEHGIPYGKKILSELNNSSIIMLTENSSVVLGTELNCQNDIVENIPMWLHIGEKYNNSILIDMTSFAFHGAYDTNADLNDVGKRHPQISFSLMYPEQTDAIVAELRTELSKKLKVDTSLYVKSYPIEHKGVTRQRIRVSLYTSNSANPPEFHISGNCNRY